MKETTTKKSDCKAVAKPPQDRAFTAPTQNERPDPTKRRPNVFSRAILPLLMAFGLAANSAANVTVTGLVVNVTGAALDTKISFLPGEQIYTTSSGLSGGPAVTISSTNGAFSKTLEPGRYLVRLPLIPARLPFTIDVPHGTGSENITNLISDPWTYADFQTTTNGGSSGTSTNAVIAISSAALRSGTNIFSGATSNLVVNSGYFYGDTTPQGTNGISGDGYGAWTYNRFLGSSVLPRHIQSIDFNFLRYNSNETATAGNAILWGVANQAGNPNNFQDNAVIVNGTLNMNWGLESTILNGIHNALIPTDLTNGSPPNNSVIVSGYYVTNHGDFSTILNGSNSVTAGTGNVIGGYNVKRTNDWEFYYGFRTNGLSVNTTGLVIEATGDMKFKGNGILLNNVHAATLISGGWITNANASGPITLQENQGLTMDTSGLTTIYSDGANIYLAALGGEVISSTAIKGEGGVYVPTGQTFAGSGAGLTNIPATALQSFGQVSTSFTGNTNVTLDISLVNATTNVFFTSLTTNAYFGQPSNLTAGKSFSVWLRQDSTGNRSVNFNTNYWRFPSAQILTTTTNPSASSLMSCIVMPYATNVAVVQTLNFQ